MKRMKIITALATVLLLAFLFFGCHAEFMVYDKIDNYPEFIGGIAPFSTQNGSGGGDHGNSADRIRIDGYVFLNNNGFDCAACFDGADYAIVKLNGEDVIIDKRGAVVCRPSDAVRIVSDTYVFIRNGKYGLKTLDGEILIDANYRNIRAVKNTAVAYDDNTVYVFSCGELKRAVSRVHDIVPYSDGLVICDGIMCNLLLEPLTFSSFKTVAISESIATIYSDVGRFGYYDITGEKIILSPQFVSATPFANGYASVQNEIEGAYYLIDTEGRKIAEFPRRMYGFHDKYILVDGEFGGVDLYDENFSNTGVTFADVYANRAFSDYIIDSGSMRIFSLSLMEYVTEFFDSVVPTERGFICKVADSATLYDLDMKKVANFDDIEYSDGVLSVKTKGKYYYFSENT